MLTGPAPSRPLLPNSCRQHWLEHVGSPASEVVKAVFSDMEPIHAPDYTDFAARPS